ncbi:hypothetical protein AVEN_173625-1, partial [Araneus ventricosus]
GSKFAETSRKKKQPEGTMVQDKPSPGAGFCGQILFLVVGKEGANEVLCSACMVRDFVSGRLIRHKKAEYRQVSPRDEVSALLE